VRFRDIREPELREREIVALSRKEMLEKLLIVTELLVNEKVELMVLLEGVKVLLARASFNKE
jgi:hypothetical protein